MATKKQIEANRRNALKSTGPKTEEGKAVVRLNALQHGITAEMAVLPFVENPADWEAHREGVLESLAPVGHLETILAERIAHLLWRMGRASRYERELIAVEQEKLEEKHFRYESEYGSLDVLRSTVKNSRKQRRVIDGLDSMKVREAINALDAVSIVEAATTRAEKVDLNDFSLPGIPDDLALEEFKSWTAGILRDAIKAIAEHEGKSYEEMLYAAKFDIAYEEAKAKLTLEKAELEIGRKRRTHLLPDPNMLDTLSRYEAHLERSLYKALHEIERLQATRAGQPVPPPLAVDVTVSTS